MKKVIACAILCATMSGCATQTFVMNDGGATEPTKQQMQPFFLSGLGQTKTMDAAAICGGADKVAKVEAHLRFIDGLLGSVTYGIFTPRSAKVYCLK